MKVRISDLRWFGRRGDYTPVASYAVIDTDFACTFGTTDDTEVCAVLSEPGTISVNLFCLFENSYGDSFFGKATLRVIGND